MGRRDLTDEEKHLWKIYTRDVEKLSADVKIPEPSDSRKRFEIKIPKKTVKLDKKASTLSNHESLESKDGNWSKKLKSGRAKPEGKIDLHGMTCAVAHEKLFHFLERSQQNGKRVVLVVTGKGGVKRDYDEYRFRDFENSHGILKREVPMWLSGGSMRHMVVSYQDALSSDGGTGALYVVLKRIK